MPLARLRSELDFMPSPVEEHPGLFIRDPYGYSPAQLIVPPPLVAALEYFDGETEIHDARRAFTLATGDLAAGDVIDHLHSALDEAGFLHGESFERIRDTRHSEFAAAPVRLPSHLGPGGYPADAAEMRTVFNDYLRSARSAPSEDTIAIAAPHVSPFGGYECYADAYAAIPLSAADKIFVVLGTSHYGEPDRFGLTRKPFETPYGQTTPVPELIDLLEREGRDAVTREDYCHAIEHSIEFQVAFLQHLFGPSIRVLPILCGSFGLSIQHGRPPESNEAVRRFLGVLGDLQAKRSRDLFWILGIDMAHIGRRYGSAMDAIADQGEMIGVSRSDNRRIESMAGGKTGEFWERVCENRDDLNWCGSSPVYTFLRSAGATQGQLLRYRQWNIDEKSVVSFAAMRFGGKERQADLPVVS